MKSLYSFESEGKTLLMLYNRYSVVPAHYGIGTKIPSKCLIPDINVSVKDYP